MQTLRIDTFLQQSPMFAINRVSRQFDSLAKHALAADNLNFMEGLVLAAIFFESPRQITPSQLAATFGTTRGNISHNISSLEAKGLLQRKIDPADARAYLLTLRQSGRKSALRVISAFEKMQQTFEKEVGKAALADTLNSIRALEALACLSAIG